MVFLNRSTRLVLKSVISKVLTLGCVTVVALSTGIVYAHTGGASLEAKSGPYSIDIGYEPEIFVAGESARFDLSLKKEPLQDETRYAQAWVRIVRERETLFATGIFRQPVGKTTLLYAFPEEGAYTLEVSFRDADGNDIASASFPISVIEGERQGAPYTFPLLAAFAGAVVGAGVVYAIGRRP